ncbi:unnamed protein product [Closterium sp. NIES-64]|nr:unnamed protein product [Closterium sp. NIES-64]
MSLTDQLHLHEPPALCPLPVSPSPSISESLFRSFSCALLAPLIHHHRHHHHHTPSGPKVAYALAHASHLPLRLVSLPWLSASIAAGVRLPEHIFFPCFKQLPALVGGLGGGEREGRAGEGRGGGGVREGGEGGEVGEEVRGEGRQGFGLLEREQWIERGVEWKESGKGAEGEGEEDEEEEVGEEDVGLETEGRERERVGVVRGVLGPHSECVECDGEGIVQREMMQRAARHEEIRSERCGVEAGGLDSREAASAGHGGLEARGAHVLRCAERTCSHAEACSATASALLGTYGNLVSVSQFLTQQNVIQQNVLTQQKAIQQKLTQETVTQQNVTVTQNETHQNVTQKKLTQEKVRSEWLGSGSEPPGAGLESLGLVSEAQDTVEMGVNEWREETGYAAAEVVRETERVVDEGSATALTRSPPPHPPSHPHTLELLPAEPRPSMPQDLVRQQSKPGSCKVRECALPEVWWESSNIHDLCCCTSCCYSCSAACPHSCSSSCSCSCSSGGGGSSSRERVSGSSGGIEMPWAWGCVRWERRVEAMEQAKGLVRARRGGQRQPASSLPRPPAPSVLLDDLAWSVSEPPTEARMLGSLVSGGVDEVGMGEGHGSDGAAGAGGSCASVGTRMHHSQLSALLYPHAFLTLLFPLDVYSEVAPSARSYFSPAGFSSLRLLSLVYSFYQASPLGACDGAGMGWGMGWGHGLGDGVGDVMGHGIGDGMGHGIGDGMGHGLVDGIGGHGMGNGIGGHGMGMAQHRLPKLFQIFLTCIPNPTAPLSTSLRLSPSPLHPSLPHLICPAPLRVWVQAIFTTAKVSICVLSDVLFP